MSNKKQSELILEKEYIYIDMYWKTTNFYIEYIWKVWKSFLFWKTTFLSQIPPALSGQTLLSL